MHALYSRLIAGDSELRNFQIPVLIQRSNLGATCAVTSTHITVILESLPKPGDDTLGDSNFLGYFQLDALNCNDSDLSTLSDEDDNYQMDENLSDCNDDGYDERDQTDVKISVSTENFRELVPKLFMKMLNNNSIVAMTN
ncbi:hypothetical protein AVEN_251713-1 [Araneus ventricosus]|uniref:Uncharacterized protein n=1 Tax=Araneus ventricosus TaxID=182803 RepID=A0A4Y2RSH5_ARAVE|nr:hypothetical protein AVEN_251713-1 [Araneus ventricosus]